MNRKMICTELIQKVDKLKSFSILILRLVVGLVFLQSGYGKLEHLEKTINYFTTLNIPFPQIQAPFVAGVEVVCGALLIFGLATRLASVFLTGTMVVALITAIIPELESWRDVFGTIELTYITIFLVLITTGAGCISIDKLLCKKCETKRV